MEGFLQTNIQHTSCRIQTTREIIQTNNVCSQEDEAGPQCAVGTRYLGNRIAREGGVHGVEDDACAEGSVGKT